jgi:hypothetical protein
VPAALAAYKTGRRPVSTKLLNAANTSSDWYERFPEHMKLKPLDFAHGYITRSGRIRLDRLRKSSPDFVSRDEARKAATLA